MSAEKGIRNADNIKMLSELQKSGGIKGIIKGAKPKFEIMPVRDGARIVASLDLGHLSSDMQKFAIAALSNSKMDLEPISSGGETTFKAVFRKEVGENYLNDEKLQMDARKYVSNLMAKPLQEEKNKLVESVRNPGFPGKPFESPFNETENKGVINRFIRKVQEFGHSLG